MRPFVLAGRRLSHRQFRRALERERLRADRGQSTFTAVFFEALSENPYWQNRLARLLDERLRKTDEFGDWSDGLAALLVGTTLEAAIVLVTNLLRDVGSDIPLVWQCFEYPSGREASGRHPDVAEQDDRQTCAQGAGGTQSASEEEVAVGQTLFVKPLPLWKRLLDIVVASLLLVLTMPILVLAAIAIKCTSPGPVLFRQRRAGLGGKPFTMYKLRTMYGDAEKRRAELLALNERDGPAFKIRNDPRVTPVGRYLRKTCIDELPQLWNVLRGDMTLVGPRPLPCEESDGCTVWQKRRLDVTPGLTCIWQAQSGKERVPFAEWMRMDLRYIERRSLWQDLKLLAKTFWAVVRHRASH